MRKREYCNIVVSQEKKDSSVLGGIPYQYLVCLQRPDPKKISKDVKSWVVVHKNCQQGTCQKSQLSYKSICELPHQNSNLVHRLEMKDYLFRHKCTLINKVKAMNILLRKMSMQTQCFRHSWTMYSDVMVNSNPFS